MGICSAQLRSKPLLHLISSLSTNEAAARLKQFVSDNHIVVLNVAGPRQSEEPGIGAFFMPCSRPPLDRPLKEPQALRDNLQEIAIS